MKQDRTFSSLGSRNPFRNAGRNSIRWVIVILIMTGDYIALPSKLCTIQGVDRAQVVAELLSAQTSSAEHGAHSTSGYFEC